MYQKPDFEYIDFTAERITSGDGIGDNEGGDTSNDQFGDDSFE